MVSSSSPDLSPQKGSLLWRKTPNSSVGFVKQGCEEPGIVFFRKLCQPQNSSGFQGEAPSLSPPKDNVNSSSPPQVGHPSARVAGAA